MKNGLMKQVGRDLPGLQLAAAADGHLGDDGRTVLQ